MANTINYIVIYLSLCIVLFVGQVASGTSGVYAGSDVLNRWITIDSNRDTYNYNSNVTQASNRLDSPSTTEGLTGNVVFNIWDMAQVVWKFIQLIFSIFFFTPFILLGSFFIIPFEFRIGLIIPLIIIGFSVFAFGVFGRR